MPSKPAPTHGRKTPASSARFSAWKEEFKTLWAEHPQHMALIAALVVVLFVGSCALLFSLSRPAAIDINAANVFSQVPTEPPLPRQAAQQVISYFKMHGVAVQNLKPYSAAGLGLAATEGLVFDVGVPEQRIIVLAYSDLSALRRDAVRFAPQGGGQISAVGSRSGAPTIAPLSTETNPDGISLDQRWHIDTLSNIVLLVDKAVVPETRNMLLSHLRSLIIAPVRTSYPTATP